MTVLFKINVEVINITTILICCAVLFVIVAVPMSFILAQIVSAVLHALSALLCELALAISLFKILLVTRFSLIFSLDPDKLGAYVLGTAAAIAFLPSAAICAYQTAAGQLIVKELAFLTKSPDHHHGIPYLTLYVVFWTIISMCMMLIAVFYIPHYIGQHLSSNSVLIAEAGVVRKQVNIKRILLGFLGFSTVLGVTMFVNMADIEGNFAQQLSTCSAPFSFNLMLSYFLLEKDVILFFRDQLLARIPVLGWLTRGASVSPADAATRF